MGENAHKFGLVESRPLRQALSVRTGDMSYGLFRRHRLHFRPFAEDREVPWRECNLQDERLRFVARTARWGDDGHALPRVETPATLTGMHGRNCKLTVVKLKRRGGHMPDKIAGQYSQGCPAVRVPIDERSAAASATPSTRSSGHAGAFQHKEGLDAAVVSTPKGRNCFRVDARPSARIGRNERHPRPLP
jgi:hypothetical protein